MENIVAVYGSLRKGMGNHPVVSDNEFITSTTLSGGFRMVSLGGFPGVMRSEGADGTISVELYRVTTPEAMQRLDRLEGYRGPGQSNFYDRETVMLDNGMEALIYTLPESEYGHYSPVENGDWVDYYNSSRNRY